MTRNSDDFRPRIGSSSNATCYLGVPLHTGLICLNPPVGADLKIMESYFKAVLSTLDDPPELVNQVIKVWPDGQGSVIVDRYDLPVDL